MFYIHDGFLYLLFFKVLRYENNVVFRHRHVADQGWGR